MWTDALHDTRYAVRSLTKSPGFSAVAIVTLSLGIGANIAIFSVVNSVLLRPLPYREVDRIVFLWTGSGGPARAPLSPARFLDFRERLQSISAVAGICQFGVVLAGAGAPERVDASSVSSSFFDVLGARALLGDPFHTGAADGRAAVLSYGLWARRFGSDPEIVGREITINGTARRVVAVMPKDFNWPGVAGRSIGGITPELWIPGAAHDIPRTPADNPAEDLSGNRRLGILRVVARLRDGVTLAQAQQEANGIAARLAEEHPATDSGGSAVLVPLREQFFGPVRAPLGVLLGAAAFVLAIACVNVANLLLGRGTSRRREIAVRLALGATRARIVRQLLTESVVLALGGSAVGLGLAWSAEKWLVALSPAGVLRLSETSIDPIVLAFGVVVAVSTGLLFGALPAWQVSRSSPNEDLKDGRGADGPRGGRTRDVLVVLEIAVALALLIGAGLLLRSFNGLAGVDTGIDRRSLLTFSVDAPGGRATPAPQQIAFYERLLERIQSLPGVARAGAAVTLPIGGDDFSTRYITDGAPLPAPGQEPSAGWQIVSRDYFEAIGMRVLSGRGFRDVDTAGSAPVVVVNETLARQAWGGRDAVGRRVRFSRDPADPWRTLVGVVSDMRHGGPGAPPRPEIYQPLAQRSFSSMAFVVRTVVPPLSIVPLVRAELSTIDPSLAIARVATMDEHVARALSRPRFMSVLTSTFGALAVALAMVGIYGVMACAVAERTREIAIRIALGARVGDVVRMIVVKAAGLAGAGVIAGLVLAWASSRLLAGLLFGVAPGDALTYVASTAGLLAVALLAAAVPARRAARIDGSRVLRS